MAEGREEGGIEGRKDGREEGWKEGRKGWMEGRTKEKWEIGKDRKRQKKSLLTRHLYKRPSIPRSTALQPTNR